MKNMPVVIYKMITDLGEVLQLRQLRNTSYEFMTNHQQYIDIITQICWYFQYYRPAVRSGNYRAYLFHDNRGALIGYGTLLLKDAQLYVTECVKPTCRKRGYGKAVLAALIKIGQNENHNIAAEIWFDNKPSADMHESAGFILSQTRIHKGKMLHKYLLIKEN